MCWFSSRGRVFFPAWLLCGAFSWLLTRSTALAESRGASPSPGDGFCCQTLQSRARTVLSEHPLSRKSRCLWDWGAICGVPSLCCHQHPSPLAGWQKSSMASPKPSVALETRPCPGTGFTPAAGMPLVHRSHDLVFARWHYEVLSELLAGFSRVSPRCGCRRSMPALDAALLSAPAGGTEQNPSQRGSPRAGTQWATEVESGFRDKLQMVSNNTQYWQPQHIAVPDYLGRRLRCCYAWMAFFFCCISTENIFN